MPGPLPHTSSGGGRTLNSLPVYSLKGRGDDWEGGGCRWGQGPVLGADFGCCLQRESLEALFCPLPPTLLTPCPVSPCSSTPAPHTSYPLSCVSLLISPCPRVSWPLATAAAAPMDRLARDSATDAHSLARACYVCLCPTFWDSTGLGVCLPQVPCAPVTALLRLNCGTSL